MLARRRPLLIVNPPPPPRDGRQPAVVLPSRDFCSRPSPKLSRFPNTLKPLPLPLPVPRLPRHPNHHATNDSPPKL